MHQRPQTGIGNGPDTEHHAGHQNGHENHHKQEARPAPGMVPGLDADIFHRQRQSRLVAEDGFMLRAMVLEYPVDILLFGAEDQIGHEHHDFQQPLHHIPPPQGEAGEEMEDSASQQRRQHQKQENGHSHPQQHRKGYNGLFQLFTAEVLFQPLFKFGGLAHLLVRVKVRRIHQRLHAADHGRQKIDGSPDQGNSQNGVAVLDELQLLHLFHHLAVLVPDDDGLLFRPPHQNALNKRLPADAGAERAVGMLCHRLVPF